MQSSPDTICLMCVTSRHPVAGLFGHSPRGTDLQQEEAPPPGHRNTRLAVVAFAIGTYLPRQI